MNSEGINIKCFTSNCLNPVIGQCIGYKKACLKFYCEDHSIQNLCKDCAQKKGEELILMKYIKTAEGIEEEFAKAKKKSIPDNVRLIGYISLSSIVLGMAIILFSEPDAPGFIFITIGVVIVIPFLPSRLRKGIEIETDILIKHEEEMPGFERFYQEWKKEKNNDMLVGTLAIIGIITTGAIVSSLANYAEDEHYRILIDKELKRHGL